MSSKKGKQIKESNSIKESNYDIAPDLAFKIYDVLGKKYPQIKKDFTKSAFYFFIDEELNKN
jgi:cytochrome c-type biogenesis protein CcmH/NrfF